MTEDKNREGISVEVTTGGDCLRTISIEVEPGLLEDEKDKVLVDFTREVTVPGFRKGKVPKDVVRKRFASEIRNEAIKSLLPGAYAHAVSAENLKPIGEPVFSDISIEENQPVRFKVEVEVEPEIALSGYKDLKLEAEKISVEEEEIDNVLESLRERYADYEDVDRDAAITDVVVIDYLPVGEDGQPDESAKAENYPVQLGAGQLFPEFEEAIIGKGKGGTGKAAIAYPEDYKPERLAGRTVEYTFTVKEVKEKRLPALDDAFAAKVDAKFSSLGDLREDIGRRMKHEKEDEARRRMEETAIDKILDANPFDIPGSMIERYRGELEKEEARRREMAGAGPEEDEGRKKEISDILDRIARRSIKRFFVIDRIAELEDVRVTDADVEAEIGRIAEGSGRPIDEIRPYFEKGGEQRRNLMGRIKERRVFDLVLARESTETADRGSASKEKD